MSLSYGRCNFQFVFSSPADAIRSTAMTRGSIMIVDDDRAFVDAVAIYLEDHGYAIAKAYTGWEGIVASWRQNIDLVIVDVHLPDLEGLEVVRALRRRHPCTPVLLISSDDSPETTARCLALDTSTFMPKPLVPKQLLETVSHLCTPPRVEPPAQAATLVRVRVS